MRNIVRAAASAASAAAAQLNLIQIKCVVCTVDAFALQLRTKNKIVRHLTLIR